MPVDDNLIGLMLRRAELLEQDAIGELTTASVDGPASTSETASVSELESVTNDLKVGLASQKPRLRSLSWDSDRELLTRLGGLEPVHPLHDPRDASELAERVSPDRRCFVLEHDALRGHPLNVVWVALTAGVPRSIDRILGPDRSVVDPAECDSAVFYSIWNVERGLQGIPGGSALLKLATADLRSELPAIHTFSTLSPIPGFRLWVEGHGDASDPTSSQDLLTRCATYLTESDESGRPTDSVARFHMRNGARLWRINLNADMSELGINRSWGLMANYRYAPEDLDANRAALAVGRPAVGSEVAGLLQEISRATPQSGGPT